MKKVCMFFLLIVVVLGSVYVSTHAANGVRTGMTFDELYKRKDLVFTKDYHFFYQNWAGNYVIARLDLYNNQAMEVRTYNYKWIFPTHAAFARLEEGMTYMEAAALVGIPFREATSGLSTADYRAADGSVYRTGWLFDGKAATLTSVRLMEDHRPAARIVYAICGVTAILIAVVWPLKKKGILFGKKNAESQ